MYLFWVGLLCGIALTILFYHFQMLRMMKKWGVDWRARCLSAEQEVLNWKNWAEHSAKDAPFLTKK